MIRVIKTKCGQSIENVMKEIDDISQYHHRAALINATIKDLNGNYVEILDVLFIGEQA